MTKIDRIALIAATVILALSAIGCMSGNRNNQSSEDGIERESDEVEREAEVEVPYTFHFISKDLIEVLDREGNPIRYNPAASGTSVGDEVEEYRQLAAYGFYTFSIAKEFDEFPMEKLDRYAHYVFKAPLTSDSDIDNPDVKRCINEAYRLEQSNGKMDQNFLLDKEGSSKAYNTKNKDDDLHYVYVEKGRGGGTNLRSEIVGGLFKKKNNETSKASDYSRETYPISRETYGVAEALPRVADYERDAIISVVNNWNDCHNTYSFYDLDDIYADRVFYYTKSYSKDHAIEDKVRAINKFVDKYGFYSQECSDIRMKRIDSQTIRCDFTKTVHMGNDVRVYHAYLEMREFGYSWKITREGDTTTDRNVSKRKK